MMGIGKYYLLSNKFISADGGFKRVVWMSANLKETMAQEFQAVAEREGDPELIDRIADGNSVTEVDELIEWLKEHNHPALEMEPMQAAPEPEEVEEVAVAVGEAESAVTAAPEPASTPEPAPIAEAEPVEVAAAPEPEPIAEAEPEQIVAAPEPKPAPELPVDASAQAIAEKSAEIVLGRIREALGAAISALGGAPPPAPAPKVEQPAVEASAAPQVAEPEPEPEQAPRKPRPESVAAPWIKDVGSDIKLVKEKWTGQVQELTLGATAADGGTRSSTLTVGGQTTLPYLFGEGSIPHKPGLAIEILDQKPTDWSPLLMKAWGDVMDDPGAWAKAVEEKGADAILLRLSATKPDESTMTAADARAAVRKVLDATGLPLIVYGPGQVELDNELLVAVAEEGKGERLVLAKCEENNYRTIVAAALANDQLVIASTAMDVNLAKQLNILVSDMGMSLDRILMDPTCAAVGYGMEYGYSVMERLRLAGLTGDKMTQLPMIVTVGYEAWRQKEARTDDGVPEAWGDWEERAVNWETLTASALVESGADLLVLRHPESMARVRTLIDELMAGKNRGG
jgi:acetyl-CoA decarbonylase/synthase complex subunit delta